MPMVMSWPPPAFTSISFGGNKKKETNDMRDVAIPWESRHDVDSNVFFVWVRLMPNGWSDYL